MRAGVFGVDPGAVAARGDAEAFGWYLFSAVDLPTPRRFRCGFQCADSGDVGALFA
ncbi:hypothetical protein L2127_05690 [Corynebacterium diphtheriae bv. mitis]|nr:hypothetical protein [Corynebacterium diphtheriae]MCM0100700.1 hypothetical protein [Corynebacterium diphtheriae bv. mitis]